MPTEYIQKEMDLLTEMRLIELRLLNSYCFWGHFFAFNFLLLSHFKIWILNKFSQWEFIIIEVAIRRVTWKKTKFRKCDFVQID